jgi:6-pyruvoyltetrahydropterin/6-carboxytetrahydropterin synthase
MKTRIYKEVQIDASHRLMHYNGKCANLHGHRWKIEVWVDGEPDTKTQIVIDYTTIKEVIGRYDHQIILNEADPMVPCIGKFQHVLTTPGDPTSELMAHLIRDDLNGFCKNHMIDASVKKIRVWESPNAFAELSDEDR